MTENSNKKKIFFGGPIITINENKPIAEAVGIEGDRIISVGMFNDVKNELGPNYELINLEGKTFLPGFIDSHLHPILSIFFLIFLDLSKVRSFQELKDLLKEKSKTKSPDNLIFGLSLKEEEFDNPEERILPTRWDLDEACPNHPVFLMRYDGHIGIVNSKTLELLEITSETQSPEGGEIRKNEKGEPTGVLSELAMSPIFTILSIPQPKEIIEKAEICFKNLASKGLTSLHGVMELDKGGETGDLGGIEIPILRTIKDKVLQNWYSLIYTFTPKKIKRLKKPPLDSQDEFGQFKANALKLWADGSFGAATAYMFEPYTDQPDKVGFLVHEKEKMYDIMKKAHNLGYQICIHSIGDKSNRIIMDLFKRLLTEFPKKDHRHRIEHLSLLTPDIIKDMAKLGVIASCQPPFINSEYTWLKKRLGKERCRFTYPIKSLIDAGIIVASGSDCPIEDPSVILGLHALVNRNGFIPEECITIEEALKTYTINGAYASFEENIKGSIEIGKLADFVILDKNPLEVKSEEIKDIKVVETIIRGKTVFKM